MELATVVKWKRAESSFHDSKCGRFAIAPIYRSTVNPSGYKLRDKKTGREYWVDRVKDAKQAAEQIIRDETDPPRKMTDREADALF